MSTLNTPVLSHEFSLRVENRGLLALRPEAVISLAPDQLRWLIGDETPGLRGLGDIRCVTLGQFGLPRGGTVWRCRIQFADGARLSVVAFSGESGQSAAYQRFVRLLHAYLLTAAQSVEIAFTVAQASQLSRFITFGILPLAGLGCLVSAFLTGQFLLLLLMAAFWVAALVQANELLVNNGQRYDPADLPHALLP